MGIRLSLPRRRQLAVVLGAALVAASLGASGSAAGGTAQVAHGAVRVDQVGYATYESKLAYLMTARPAPGARFAVVDGHGGTVLSGRVGASTGAWSASYGAVHPIDLSACAARVATGSRPRVGRHRRPSGSRRPGRCSGRSSTTRSPSSGCSATARNVVPGILHRKPSHLADRRATVYHQPVFTGDGGDVPAEPLQAFAGLAPVDVEGGWFDAGDFVKFAHASAYSLGEMLYRPTDVRHAGPEARDPARAAWLDKVWDAKSKILYAQVGIGTGSEEFGFLGDHDVWRLPEADDRLQTGPGDES